MPIYEFRCNACQRKTSIFVKSVSSPVNAACASCGSKDMQRLIGSFGIARSVKDVHSEYGNPNSPDYYKDPRNIGRWTEEKFSQMGMEMPGRIRDMIDGAREGQLGGAVKDLQPNVGEI